MTVEEKALHFATKAHEGQTRKTTGTPMIGHPIRVAHTLKKAGFNSELVAAGFLHDTVEDTFVTMEVIEREFGPTVATYVKGNTENKDHSWEKRKEHTIAWIAKAPLEVKALIVADKLDNLTSLIDSYEEYGEEVWHFFKRGKEQQKWYFTSIAKHMTEGLPTEDIPAFFDEYAQKVNHFFA